MNLRFRRLPFQVQVVDSPATVTAHAALPQVIEGFRTLGLAAAAPEHVHFNQRLRSRPRVRCAETLLAAGGECVDDVRVLHADAGLLPAAWSMSSWLAVSERSGQWKPSPWVLPAKGSWHRRSPGPAAA